MLLIAVTGIGPLRPNTVMCEWPEKWESLSVQTMTGHVDRVNCYYII